MGDYNNNPNTVSSADVVNTLQKKLFFGNIKPGMRQDEINMIVSCALEDLYGKINLSRCNIDYSYLEIAMSDCPTPEQLQDLLCKIIASVINRLKIHDMTIANLTHQITELTTEVGSVTDEKVKTSSSDPAAGFLAEKVFSNQSGAVTIESQKLKLAGFIPIGSIIIYDGSWTNFDSTGLGKSGTDVYGFAMCNGNNGTRNIHRLFVQATTTNSEHGTIAGLTNNQNVIIKGNLPAESYSISGSTSTAGAHTHTLNGNADIARNSGSGHNTGSSSIPLGFTGISLSTDGNHSHGFTATFNLNSGSVSPLSVENRHMKMLYIKRIF